MPSPKQPKPSRAAIPSGPYQADLSTLSEMPPEIFQAAADRAAQDVKQDRLLKQVGETYAKQGRTMPTKPWGQMKT
ncbi:hypothetical protein [Jannaschia seohaensis]|uniref:Uncharacterized protein n=1 Tax=Jannaschia seohaensis TaxID=475081 RepID=A0A2Y9B1D6_9RHOB|nr:hypothetical protein [Jannaschia seohaensis]PWJ13807.1 hypothetical protein BCF38_11338 [Jannaschia seohaensis]SSA50320.1 hypothetical protein SAMN05421539_11338 [Jannaschia seohaensis]